ncbi:MAG: GAF domain-containing protein [Candidatus Zixiibacteriota bacterium]
MTGKPTHRKPRENESVGPLSAADIFQDLTRLGRERNATDQMALDILHHVQNWAGFDAGTLYVYVEEKRRLEAVASIGEQVDTLGFLSMGHGQGLAGWSSLANRPVLLADRTGTIGFNPERDFGTFASLPLPATVGTIGALNLGWRCPKACDEPLFQMLLSIADQVGLIMECSLCRQRQNAVQVRLAQVLEERPISTTPEDYSRRLVSAREFAATLKYQINDPLSIIVGNAQCLLAEETTFSQKHVSRLRRIEEAALRINEINDKLRQLDSLLAAAAKTEVPPATSKAGAHRTANK